MNLTPVCTNTCLVTYNGENLENLGAKKGTKLNSILKNISNLFKSSSGGSGNIERVVKEWGGIVFR